MDYFEIVKEEAKKKAKKEFFIGGHTHFDIDDCESYLIRFGMKEVTNFLKGDKGDIFLRYLRYAMNQDFKNFISSQYKRNSRIAFSLNDLICFSNDGNEDKEVQAFAKDESLKVKDTYSFIEQYADIEKILLGRLLEVYKLDLEGYTGNEIAIMLGINKNTVTSDLKKIKEAITSYKTEFEGEIITGTKTKSIPIDVTYERLYKEDYSKYCNVGNKPMFTQNGFKNPIPWEEGNTEASTVRKGRIVDEFIVWEDGRVEKLAIPVNKLLINIYQYLEV
jgi:hypothetical protein